MAHIVILGLILSGLLFIDLILFGVGGIIRSMIFSLWVGWGLGSFWLPSFIDPFLFLFSKKKALLIRAVFFRNK